MNGRMRRIVIMWVMVGALAAGCAPERGLHATAPLCAGSPVRIALCEDYPPEARNSQVVERDLAEMDRLGVHMLRVALAWDDIESQPGEYDWRFSDLLFDLAARHHVRLIPYVCYTPRWAAAEAGKDFWRGPPRDEKAFGRFMSAAAARYRGRTGSWELWNEPDNADYWLGTVAQYARLVNEGAAAVRAADPAAKIVLGGISWNEAFLAAVLREPGVASSIDVVNLHSYDETWLPEPMEDLPDHIRRVHDLIARYGHRQEIWLAEAGYSDFRGRDGDISASYRARFAYEHTTTYQADALVRMVTLAASSGDVRLIAWYRINDLPQNQDVIGDVNNRHLGILDVSGREKPLATALRLISDVFGSGATACDDRAIACRKLNSAMEIHCFAQKNGDLWLVAWIRNDVPGARIAGETGAAEDRRSEEVEISLAGSFVVRQSIDAHGAREGLVPAKLEGSATSLAFQISAGTTYLVQLDSAGASGKN